MDNFISTIVFLIPGFLMYFWIQSFGVNPVVKHSGTEMAAISALLWLPVSLATIIVHNWIGSIYKVPSIWTLDELKSQSGNLNFLAWFSFLSIPISFLLSIIYTRVIYPVQRISINGIRRLSGNADLSDTSTVWEKFFIKVNMLNNGNLPVKIFKIDKPEETCMFGLISNASRPFETERAIVLERSAELSASHECYNYEVTRTYVDLKSGIAIAELDLNKPSPKQASNSTPYTNGEKSNC